MNLTFGKQRSNDLSRIIELDDEGNLYVTGGAGATIGVTPAVGVAGDGHAPAVNTAAVVTYAAVAGQRHYITGVAWSYYGGIPTGGNLQITDAGAVVFDIDINEEGPGFFVFPSPKVSALVNTAMVITLTAGGAAIAGKISILNHWLGV